MDLGGSIWASADRPRLYFPAQLSEAEALFVRGKGDPERTGALLEKALAQMAAPDRVINVFSIEERRYWDLYPVHAASWVASLLGGLALLLTASGIYGVLSYLVSQRTKEIGIRMALGATPRSVVGFIMGYSMKLAGIGLVLGGLLAMGVSKLFVSLFAGRIDVFDGVAYTAGLAVVALTAAMAALGPARRATQVDPANTLRSE
jgi:predicted lysophospholipase L1 biosynthesis ABC-type transport system permease subunit